MMVSHASSGALGPHRSVAWTAAVSEPESPDFQSHSRPVVDGEYFAPWSQPPVGQLTCLIGSVMKQPNPNGQKAIEAVLAELKRLEIANQEGREHAL
jgi:hypothetical protein